MGRQGRGRQRQAVNAGSPGSPTSQGMPPPETGCGSPCSCERERSRLCALRTSGWPGAGAGRDPQPSTLHGSAAARERSEAGFGHLTLKLPALRVEACAPPLPRAQPMGHLPDRCRRRPPGAQRQRAQGPSAPRVCASAPHGPCLNLERPCFFKTDD